jgi:hypothetical protein
MGKILVRYSDTGEEGAGDTLAEIEREIRRRYPEAVFRCLGEPTLYAFLPDGDLPVASISSAEA